MSRGVRAAGVLALVLLGCAEREPVAITEVSPPYGPLGGGTAITIHGHGFDSVPRGETRVMIDGRAAPLVATLDDGALAVVTPPGARPGPADVEVVVGDRAVRAPAAFRYSAPPTIASATPADVLHAGGARGTVTGSGFADEDAGPPALEVGGTLVAVEVESDTTLSFDAPAGRAFLKPELQLLNRRGRASHPRAFRYIPGTRPGLLLFGKPGSFATYLDPVDLRAVDIPWAPGASMETITAVVRDERGEYWSFSRGGRLGRLDLGEQLVDGGAFTGRGYPAIERVGDGYVAIERTSLLGRFTVPDAAFSSAGVPPWRGPRGSFGLAFDGTTLYASARNEVGAGTVLYAIDPSTLEVRPAVQMFAPAGFFLEDMRFFAGTLYAGSRDGKLVTIDPASGVVTVLPVAVGRVRAIAIFE